MPRLLLLPLSAMVVLSVAIAMLASAVLLPEPDPAGPSARDGATVVQRFYAAVNQTIASGNSAALQHVVSPAFLDENPLPGVDPGREGLESYLRALHSAVPGLRLGAEVIAVSADRVVARVTVRDDQTWAALPGAFGERPAVWSAVDVFRIADGAVVGRWGSTDGLTVARPLAAGTLTLPIPTPRVVTLARVTLAPGASWDAPLAGPRFLVVEDGALDVQAAPASAAHTTLASDASGEARDDTRSDAPQRAMLATGGTWQTPAGSRLSATNVGAAPAHLLVVTFSEPQIPNGIAPAAEALPSGVEVQILAGALATRLGTGAVTIVLEQITLGPDAGLSLSSAAGPILIAVETAQAEASLWGTGWVRHGGDGRSVASHAAIVTAEDGLLIQPGGFVALHNSGEPPVHVLVVAIQTTSLRGQGDVGASLREIAAG